MVLVAAPKASAAANGWATAGPGGATIGSLAIDPSNASVAFAGTNGAQVFKTVDGGATWFWSGNGLPLGLAQEGNDVGAFVIDPVDTGTVYAATPNGLYKSTDGGARWFSSDVGMASLDIYSLALDPADPSTVYAGTPSGLYRSRDSGGSWSLIWDAAGPTAIEVDPSNSNVLYAGLCGLGCGGFGLYKSVDGGASWREADSGINVTYPGAGAIVIDPAGPATLYAAVASTVNYNFVYAVYKTTTSGRHWFKVSDEHIYRLQIDPVTPSTVYGSSSSSVYRSTDGGMTWDDVGSVIDGTGFLGLALAPSAPAIIYAGSATANGHVGGVFKSSDGGNSWSQADSGIVNTSVRSLAVSASGTETMYAEVDGEGVSRSADGGRSWVDASAGLGNSSINAVAVSPIDARTAYAGGANVGPRLSKTKDGGASWHEADGGLPDDSVAAIVVDPSQPSTIYVGMACALGCGSPVYKSTDAGTSWTATRLPADEGGIYSLALDPLNPTTIFAATLSGLFKSTDGGQTWAFSGNGLTGDSAFVLSFGFDPIHGITYAGTASGFFESTDGGGTWTEVTGLQNLSIRTVAVDPKDPARIAVGTNSCCVPFEGVLITADGGVHWRTFNRGLHNDQVWAVVFAGPSGRHLYAATAGGGVFGRILR